MQDTQTQEAVQTEQGSAEAPKEIKTKKTPKFVSSHGRRKEAVARVRLFTGKGQTLINGKPAEVYFPSEIARIKFAKPFDVTKTVGKYFATIKVSGSGKNSQLDAAVHGVSRALTAADQTLRPLLKHSGLLTRDPRVRERRKYGLAQKARKGKQSPKR